MNSKVLVSGVSGPIGAALLPSLPANSWSVTRLVRGPAANENQISWDPARPIPPEAVSGFDAVIHLAGETIFGRWTAAKKQKILHSRVEGTGNLAELSPRRKRSRRFSSAARPSVITAIAATNYFGRRAPQAGDFSPRLASGGKKRPCLRCKPTYEPLTSAQELS